MIGRHGPAWLGVVLATSAVQAAPEPGQIRSPALRVEARFPKAPKLYRSEAYYGNGYCRAFHYALRAGKKASEREFDLMVLQHRRLKGTAEEVLERFAKSELDDKTTVLDKQLVDVGGHTGMRITYRTAANDYRGAVETRAQYVVVGKTVYKLVYTAPVGAADSNRRWLLLRSTFKILPQPVSHAWLPHLSGRGGFAALFPKRPKETEETVERDGRKVQQVRVSLNRPGSSLWITSREATPALKTGKRKARKRARRSLFAAARTQASSGISGVTVQRDEAGRRSLSLVLAGTIDGEPALRVWRTILRRGRVVTASATRSGTATPREELEAFVHHARSVPIYDDRTLDQAELGGGISGGRLGTGETLSGTHGSAAKGAVRVSTWRMARDQFRVADAKYLSRPAVMAYANSWSLHKHREATLEPRKGGAGVARTYFTRDGDDLLAIHERIVIDSEGYRSKTIVLRNGVVDPKHLSDLFAD